VTTQKRVAPPVKTAPAKAAASQKSAADNVPVDGGDLEDEADDQ
jgi:hypothetical protein